MNQFCEGVWEEYAEAFGTDEFTPIKFPADRRDQLIEAIKASIRG